MAAEIYALIGAEIRRRREGRGLSQAQLADRIGVGRTTVTMIESGAQALLVHQLLDVASALRTDLSALLKEVAQEERAPPPTARPVEISNLLTELDQLVTRITR